MNYTPIHEQIKDARAATKLSQWRFSAKVGHSRGAQQSYETAKTRPNAYQFLKIMDAGYKWVRETPPSTWPIDVLYVLLRVYRMDPSELAWCHSRLVEGCDILQEEAA